MSTNTTEPGHRASRRSRAHLLPSLAILGLVAVTILTVQGTPAGAQPADDASRSPRFTQPKEGTVRTGAPLKVAGIGCSAGSMVALNLAGESVTVRADKRGRFAASRYLPKIDVDPNAESFDIYEMALAGECDGERFLKIIVPAHDAEKRSTVQVRKVPRGGVQTGAGGTAADVAHAVSARGAAAVVAGLVSLLVIMLGVRRRHGAQLDV